VAVDIDQTRKHIPARGINVEITAGRTPLAAFSCSNRIDTDDLSDKVIFDHDIVRTRRRLPTAVNNDSVANNYSL
jgi:hypothetical protein